MLRKRLIFGAALVLFLATSLAPPVAAAPGCAGGPCCSGDEVETPPPCHRAVASWSAPMTCCEMSQAPAVPAPTPSVAEPSVPAPAVVEDDVPDRVGLDGPHRTTRCRVLGQRRAIGLFTLYSSFLN